MGHFYYQEKAISVDGIKSLRSSSFVSVKGKKTAFLIITDNYLIVA